MQFEAPNSSFQIQVTGVDNNEVPLSRVNRAGVDITDIQLVLGRYCILDYIMSSVINLNG